MNEEQPQILLIKEEIKTESLIDDIPCIESNKDSQYVRAEDAVYVGNTLYKAYEVRNDESFNQSASVYEKLITDLPGNGNHLFECPLCYYTSEHKKHLRKHFKKHETHGKKHMCGLCGHRTVSSEQMVKHLKTHTKEEQTFSCSYCSNFRGTSAPFRKHMKTVHNDYWPFKCNVCSSGFRLYRSLSVHLASHEANQQYSCPVCPKRAPKKNLIAKHYRNCHRRKKSFKCSQCDYACENRTTLQNHMRKHTGERPFKCEYCGKFRAASKSTLRIHMRQHTGERPYKCSLCSYSTIQRSPFRAHLQKHLKQDPLGCWLCIFRTAKVKSLKIHKRQAHSSRLVCFHCQLTFERFTLKKHIRDEHGIPDPIPTIDDNSPNKDPLA